MEHALTGGPDYSIYGLVMGADPVVKGVMILLVLASVATWAIIFEKMIRLRRLRRAIQELEDEVGALDQHSKRPLVRSVLNAAQSEVDEGAIRGLHLGQRGDELAGEGGLELADLHPERLPGPPHVRVLERDAGASAGAARPELPLHPPAHVARDGAGGAEPRPVDGPGEADLVLVGLSRLDVAAPSDRRWGRLAPLGGEGGGGEMEKRDGDGRSSEHGRLRYRRRGLQRTVRLRDRQ